MGYVLSKTKYCRAFQCKKMLWMDANKSEEAIRKASESVLATGSEVGDVAMGYFGEFVEVPFSYDKQEMCGETTRLLNEGVEVITEASFMYEDCFCSADILRKVDGGYDLIEVKSSTSVHDIYYEDMAYQYYVLTHCGIKVNKVWNMHINNRYVRKGELNLKELFNLVDCTEDCKSRQASVESYIKDVKKYMEQSAEPEQHLGMFCEKPYECDYKEYCRGVCGVTEPSVFSVSNMTAKKMYEYYDKGIITFADLVRENVKLTDHQKLQVQTELNNEPPHIDKARVKAFLATLSYPLYHLDFETFQQAIPEYDGVRPYMQIPFQYSLHVQRSAGADPEHYEFLAKEGTDPRRALAESLCKDIPKDVCSLAFNMSFEQRVIWELAAEFPDLAEHLMNIHDHMHDLMVPFAEKSYYIKEFEGRYTIKYVLPALCKGDPELDYHALSGVHNGSEAMAAFANLQDHTPEEIEVIRKQLLAYCRLDTLAMVKVLEKLYRV